MANSYVLKTTEQDRWDSIIQRCDSYDVYHLSGYHRLAEEQESCRAVLVVYEAGITVIAVPLLLRGIEEVSGTEVSEYLDATSVYGYPGPVSNAPSPSEEVTCGFAAALRGYLESKKVISVFSRLHPLLNQEVLLSGNGEVLDVSPTVAIDLSLPADVQYRQYRKGHQYDIDKAKRNGVICVHDEDWDYLDAFVDIYYETMHRVDADDYYFFDRAYFARLRQLLGNHLHLFVALKEDAVISGALFTVCGSIIQYHLSGTASHHRDLAPSKLILDTVRLWGMEIGAKVFHLGGGVGGKKDGLFRFKAGFSDQTYRFKVWRMIVDQEVYQQLTSQEQTWYKAQGLAVVDKNYFPAYRAPACGVCAS